MEGVSEEEGRGGSGGECDGGGEGFEEVGIRGIGVVGRRELTFDGSRWGVMVAATRGMC